MGKNHEGVTRRDFLRGGMVAGVSLSLAGLAGCAPKDISQKKSEGSSAGRAGLRAADVQWDKEADVVVVGLGGAGSAAALDAHKGGAEVVVIEATEMGGGSTAVNGGYVYLGGGTELQQKLNVDDTADQMYAYLTAAGGETASQEAIRIACDNAPDLFKWCQEMGMEFPEKLDEGYVVDARVPGVGLAYSGNERAFRLAKVTPPVPRGHLVSPDGNGMGFIRPLKAAIEAAGIEVLYNTAGKALVADDAGRVVGVAVESKGNTTYIKARRGVALTCGGFGLNKEMMDAVYPFSTKRGAHITAAPPEDGSGILMGMAIGADTHGMSRFQSGMPLYTYTVSCCKGMLVDGNGQRIAAENEYNSFIGGRIVRSNLSAAYLIVTDGLAAEIAENIDMSRITPTILKAASMAELAPQIGVAPETLQNTLDVYEAGVSAGVDYAYGKPDKFLVSLATGPYTAYYLGSDICYNGTLGGLRINTDAQVLDTEGSVIPGLYAAGRNSGLFYGFYMGSGTSMLDCFTFGRIAGQKLAAEKPAA